jgi:hypothetical protein
VFIFSLCKKDTKAAGFLVCFLQKDKEKRKKKAFLDC